MCSFFVIFEQKSSKNMIKTRKKEILTRAGIVQHPNSGQNIQHLPLFVLIYFSSVLLLFLFFYLSVSFLSFLVFKFLLSRLFYYLLFFTSVFSLSENYLTLFLYHFSCLIPLDIKTICPAGI